ncbi:2-oxoglutarate dehydrogenase E1 component [Azovibrio restrictus]|uniref:2-oxoglutarate dehydrogenase E1 component n=1 Tax=Azovibrio restrictus TaxID=146938 RepID=UPI0026EE629B|nr:2-oxoglutarate dehydrogenase E1 component [Azovibrio restrictus]MDD3481334.1 2-oxoglutarate dehydrogenase E1 component [Azovibrio restrictus]
MIMQKLESTLFFGGNAPFVEELYENYLEDPASVPEEWRAYFDKLAQQPGNVAKDVPHAPVIAAFAEQAKQGGFRQATPAVADDGKQVSVLQLINAYRFLGNRKAELDPLKRLEHPAVPELELSHYDLSNADLNRSFNTGSFRMGAEHATLGKILEAAKETYCGSVGVEYMYLTSTQEKRWIQERLEPIRARATYSKEDKKRLLERVTAAETLERYLHTKYVGQKRFSLEGGESLIASMDELIRESGIHGVQEVVIGMAHRGRLNVLVNTLGKKPSMLFAEFEGKKASDLSAGDVKYHMGYSSDVGTPGGPVHLTLAFNPSHLEIINPVVEGSVYARQLRYGPDGKKKIIPVLIHGDSAVAGQGVNQEMLNFAQTRGYGTGGTIHIVVNNQIGFTTSDPRDYRSGYYCTEIFKMAEAPIFHVNGDDVEAVALVTKLAVDYRQQFGKDVVIDIYCYRKLGHNEQDEPMVTQPLMYKKVQAHPGSRKVYADKLVAEGTLAADEPDNMIKEYRAHLDKGELLYNPVLSDYSRTHAQDWKPYLTKKYIEICDTKVPAKEITRLSERLTTLPEGFTLHSRVKKIVEDRRAMGEGKQPFDWGMAENLAYATLLTEGFGVRLSGEDVGRGTFFHRHAAFHDQNRAHWSEGTYHPLANLQEKQGRFQCYDSVLSEEGVLAFEYGYATAEPNELIIWEAQFGDFANGAQVVIDQFISSGEAKWGRGCGLVMLLPHGYEGQGPEHSSARLERYMQACAEMNMEVCVPTTPSQIYHLLRRQAVRKQRKPLVVMTPKSLLRHKDAISSMDELANGEFKRVIGEVDAIDAKKVTRVVLCSGKIYYDLLAARREKKLNNIAIVRIEQLYPFPEESFAAEMAKYPKATEIVWCQEEPRNQGAWYWFASRQHLARSVGPKQHLLLVARPAAASPAVGYLAKHNEQHKALIESAMGKIDY